MEPHSTSLIAKNFDRIEALLRAFDRRRLTHALLFCNQSDPGFRSKIGRFIKNILCYERFLKTETKPCGYCDSCLVLSEPIPSVQELKSRFQLADAPQTHFEKEGESGPLWTHPDFVWLAPESIKGYSVEQIKTLQSRFSLRPSLSEIRLAWIEDAEALSGGGGAAANALLKILEEPRPDTFIILSTNQGGSILPTLQSRCQKFIFWNDKDELLENRNGVSSRENLHSWRTLEEWILKGAPDHHMIVALPGDTDLFWKNRDMAMAELLEIQESLWFSFSKKCFQLSREQSMRCVKVIESFQELIKSIQQFGQPHLQWMNFRENTKMGYVKYANN
jgi:hypothetical protein